MKFRKPKPKPKPQKVGIVSTVDDVLRVAKSQLGYRETGSNRSKYGAAYGLNGQPWCAMYVWWVFRECGIDLRRYSDNVAYTPNFADDLLRHGWSVGKSTARPGDIVFYDFPDKVRRIQHVGIVVQNNGNSIVAIEGNTSGSNNSNGGRVMLRTRSMNLISAVRRPPMLALNHPVEPKNPPPAPSPAASNELIAFAKGLNEAKTHVLQLGSKGKPVEYLQIMLNIKYGGSGKTGLLVDGDFGPRTHDFVVWTQGVSGLVKDGIVGPATWKSIAP